MFPKPDRMYDDGCRWINHLTTDFWFEYGTGNTFLGKTTHNCWPIGDCFQLVDSWQQVDLTKATQWPATKHKGPYNWKAMDVLLFCHGNACFVGYSATGNIEFFWLD